MKSKEKNVLIIISLIVMLAIGGFIGYKKYSTIQLIKHFKAYMTVYEKEFENYNLNDEQKKKYNELITKANIAINFKSKDDMKNLEIKLSAFKKKIKEENNNIRNISGRYTYEKLNKHGVETISEVLNISEAVNGEVKLNQGSNYLQHGNRTDGTIVPPEDVTKEMSDSGAILCRGTTNSGVLQYKGNGVWEGFIFLDSYSDNSSEDKNNSKIPCKLITNGNKAIFSSKGKTINYKKCSFSHSFKHFNLIENNI